MTATPLIPISPSEVWASGCTYETSASFRDGETVEADTQMVGAIHGRLLTAWAAAGVLGPVLVNYLREYQLSHGVARADAYDITLYILAGLLVWASSAICWCVRWPTNTS